MCKRLVEQTAAARAKNLGQKLNSNLDITIESEIKQPTLDVLDCTREVFQKVKKTDPSALSKEQESKDTYMQGELLTP